MMNQSQVIQQIGFFLVNVLSRVFIAEKRKRSTVLSRLWKRCVSPNSQISWKNADNLHYACTAWISVRLIQRDYIQSLYIGVWYAYVSGCEDSSLCDDSYVIIANPIGGYQTRAKNVWIIHSLLHSCGWNIKAYCNGVQPREGYPVFNQPLNPFCTHYVFYFVTDLIPILA